MPQAPLVIVSEHGRHDQASRRIVRAQAARASAPQSRLTRARNRGERGQRPASVAIPELHDLPAATPPPPPPEKPSPAPPATGPLRTWLREAFPHRVDSLTDESALAQHRPSAADDRLRLPPAIPRGFVELAGHTGIDKQRLDVISRTACFDLASPGVEQRLQQLLSDLILAAAIDTEDRSMHEMLRLACVSLLLRHGTTLEALKGKQHLYFAGLAAAWQEAEAISYSIHVALDTAPALCWAAVMISVTAGSVCHDNGSVFGEIVRQSLSQTNVKTWEGIRALLLDFIFPCSTLEDACVHFLRACTP